MKASPNELVITAEAEEALKALQKVLLWSLGHTVLFAVTNSLPAQQSLTELLQDGLAPERVSVRQITLEGPVFHHEVRFKDRLSNSTSLLLQAQLQQ